MSTLSDIRQAAYKRGFEKQAHQLASRVLEGMVNKKNRGAWGPIQSLAQRGKRIFGNIPSSARSALSAAAPLAGSGTEKILKLMQMRRAKGLRKDKTFQTLASSRRNQYGVTMQPGPAGLGAAHTTASTRRSRPHTFTW